MISLSTITAWSKRAECIEDDIILANAPALDQEVFSISNQAEALMSKKKGGRPKGTTNHSKKELSDAIIVAKNEIVDMYSKEKRNSQGKMLKSNTLKIIISEMKLKINLLDDVEIKKSSFVIAFIKEITLEYQQESCHH